MKKLLSVLLVLIVTLALFMVPFSAVNAANSNSSKPHQITGLKVTTANKQELLKLSWDKQLQVDGYQIYRSTTGKTGSYKKIATIRSSNRHSYTDTNLKAAKTYYYAIRAFQKANGKVLYGKFAKGDLSTRLTKAAIQKKLVAANRFYVGWVLHCVEAFDCLDYNDTKPVPGDQYGFVYIRVKSNKYQSVSDLKKEAAKHFTKSVYKRTLEDEYADINGKLYRKSYDMGGDAGNDKGAVKILSLTDNTCRFKVISHYPDSEDSYTFTDMYSLIYKNGRWLFKNMTDSFGIYYQGNDYWK